MVKQYIYIFKAKVRGGDWTVIEDAGKVVEIPATSAAQARVLLGKLHPSIYEMYDPNNIVPIYDMDRTEEYKHRLVIQNRQRQRERIERKEEEQKRLQGQWWNEEPPLAPPGGVDKPSS